MKEGSYAADTLNLFIDRYQLRYMSIMVHELSHAAYLFTCMRRITECCGLFPYVLLAMLQSGVLSQIGVCIRVRSIVSDRNVLSHLGFDL